MNSNIDDCFMKRTSKRSSDNNDSYYLENKLSPEDYTLFNQILNNYDNITSSNTIMIYKELIRQQKYEELLKRNEELIPSSIISGNSHIANAFSRRYQDNFSFSIPSRECFEAIREFVQGNQLLDPFAGLGLFAGILQSMNVDVIATDSNELFRNKVCFTQVEKLDAREAISEYPTNYLLLSWLPWSNSIGCQTLGRFSGEYLIYFGEMKYGCCATNNFFDLLEEEFTFLQEIPIRSFSGINDRCIFYKRSKSI